MTIKNRRSPDAYVAYGDRAYVSSDRYCTQYAQHRIVMMSTYHSRLGQRHGGVVGRIV